MPNLQRINVNMNKLLNDALISKVNLPILKQLREKGEKSFEVQGIPNAKTEKWKYTKIRELNIDDFVFAKEEDYANLSSENVLNFSAYEIRFYNGRLLKSDFNLPKEIKIMNLAEVFHNKEYAKYLNKSFDMDKFPFAALNTAHLEHGIFIKVSQGYQAKKPLALVYHINADKKYFSNIRNIIVLEDEAKLDIVEYFYHTGDIKAQYFNNIVNEIDVGKNAILGHYKVQNDAFKSFHIALSCIDVKSGGRYNGFCLQKGANLSRNETLVRLVEKNSQATVNAAYIINGWTCSDTTTNIEHLCSDTTSNQLIKGVVGGNAKGVFQGKIHIAPEAIRTKGYQLHKTLLLSDEAEVDVKPELEIFADDVRCSHGSTCGEIDKDQMFYLRSRGISEENAKNILIAAFIEEPMSCIDNPNIMDWIKSF